MSDPLATATEFHESMPSTDDLTLTGTGDALACVVGVALSLPPGYPGSVGHGALREKMVAALKSWRSIR